MFKCFQVFFRQTYIMQGLHFAVKMKLFHNGFCSLHWHSTLIITHTKFTLLLKLSEDRFRHQWLEGKMFVSLEARSALGRFLIYPILFLSLPISGRRSDMLEIALTGPLKRRLIKSTYEFCFSMLCKQSSRKGTKYTW